MLGNILVNNTFDFLDIIDDIYNRSYHTIISHKIW